MTCQPITAVSGDSAANIIGKHSGAIAVLFHGRKLVGTIPTNLRTGERAWVIFDDKELLKGMKPELTPRELRARQKRFDEQYIRECSHFQTLKTSLERVLPAGLDDDLVLAAFFKALGPKCGPLASDIAGTVRSYFDGSKTRLLTESRGM
jgi:hypothetical protein